MAEREQIPAATFPKSVLLIESLHGRVEAVVEGFQLRCSSTTYECEVQLLCFKLWKTQTTHPVIRLLMNF